MTAVRIATWRSGRQGPAGDGSAMAAGQQRVTSGMAAGRRRSGAVRWCMAGPRLAHLRVLLRVEDVEVALDVVVVDVPDAQAVDRDGPLLEEALGKAAPRKRLGQRDVLELTCERAEGRGCERGVGPVAQGCARGPGCERECGWVGGAQQRARQRMRRRWRRARGKRTRDVGKVLDPRILRQCEGAVRKLADREQHVLGRVVDLARAVVMLLEQPAHRVARRQRLARGVVQPVGTDPVQPCEVVAARERHAERRAEAHLGVLPQRIAWPDEALVVARPDGEERAGQRRALLRWRPQVGRVAVADPRRPRLVRVEILEVALHRGALGHLVPRLFGRRGGGEVPAADARDAQVRHPFVRAEVVPREYCVGRYGPNVASMHATASTGLLNHASFSFCSSQEKRLVVAKRSPLPSIANRPGLPRSSSTLMILMPPNGASHLSNSCGCCTSSVTSRDCRCRPGLTIRFTTSMKVEVFELTSSNLLYACTRSSMLARSSGAPRVGRVERCGASGVAEGAEARRVCPARPISGPIVAGVPERSSDGCMIAFESRCSSKSTAPKPLITTSAGVDFHSTRWPPSRTGAAVRANSRRNSPMIVKASSLAGHACELGELLFGATAGSAKPTPNLHAPTRGSGREVAWVADAQKEWGAGGGLGRRDGRPCLW
eukprot:1210587-Prymnesium_polylepis.1